MNTNERKFPGINATMAAIQEEAEKNGYFNLYEFATKTQREVFEEILGESYGSEIFGYMFKDKTPDIAFLAFDKDEEDEEQK